MRALAAMGSAGWASQLLYLPGAQASLLSVQLAVGPPHLALLARACGGSLRKEGSGWFMR